MKLFVSHRDILFSSHGLSLILLLFLVTGAATVYLLFIFICYRKEKTEYNGYILYITGALQSLLNMWKPITVITLGVDRIYSILFPGKYHGTRKYYPIYGAILVILGTTIAVFTVRITPTWPTNSFTKCTSYGCMTTPGSTLYYTTHRFVCAGVNFIVGIVLMILIKKKIKSLNSNKVRFLLFFLRKYF